MMVIQIIPKTCIQFGWIIEKGTQCIIIYLCLHNIRGFIMYLDYCVVHFYLSFIHIAGESLQLPYLQMLLVARFI
jgi:hypothetical protein